MGLFDLGVDWSEVEAPAFDNVPEGIYEATLTNVEPYESDRGKAIVFDYLITEDEAHDGRYTGRTVKEFQNYADTNGITENGIKYLKARLINLGVPEDYNINQLDKDDVVGAEVAITITKRSNAKGTFFNVTRVELLGGKSESKPKPAAVSSSSREAAQEPDDDNPFG